MQAKNSLSCVLVSFIAFTVFYLQPAFAEENSAAAEPVQGRYVRVELYGEERYLSLAEVEVFDADDNNIALDKNATQSSDYSYDYPASKAVNGQHDDFTHTFHWPDQRYHFWQVDLGNIFEISKIRILNRYYYKPGEILERINPARVLIVDSENNIVWESKITSGDLEFVFNVEQSDIASMPVNQLLNSNFSKRTNPEIPDYWGVRGDYHAAVPDAHELYKVNNTIAPPSEVSHVSPGVSVVEITNDGGEGENGYSHLIFYPYQKVDARPPGHYTLSFYLKSDRATDFRIAKTKNLSDTKIMQSTTAWKRHDVTFHWDGNTSVTVAPALWFNKKDTYYIAAPQLEQGTQVSDYHQARVDMLPSDPYIDDAATDIVGRTLSDDAQYTIYDAANAPLSYQNDTTAQFEYDYYTEDDSDIVLNVESKIAQSVDIVITHGDVNVFTQTAELVEGQNRIQLLVSEFSTQGKYDCLVVDSETNTSVASATFKRITANPDGIEIRINRLTGAPEIKNLDDTVKPFYIQGISDNRLPDADWYYQDFANQGINTVVLFRKIGGMDDSNFADYKAALDKALVHAHNAGLKVILGYAWAGATKYESDTQIDTFYTLIKEYKNNSNIIAWYVLDEFSNQWSNQDLLDIYNTIKEEDPYRPVMLNWRGYMSDIAGKEPDTFSEGVFDATDIYSRTGIYPFTKRRFYKGSKLSEHVKVSITAQRTAKAFNKGAHGWIQMFGYDDVWREPTIDELRYMAYLNVMYGSMYSYFGKTFSTDTWDQIGEIQQETAELAKIVLDKESQVLFQPRIDDDQGNFIYTAVKDKNGDTYVIVIRNNHPMEDPSQEKESFTFNCSDICSSLTKITSKYEADRVVLSDSDGLVTEGFLPWETRVYVVENL